MLKKIDEEIIKGLYFNMRAQWNAAHDTHFSTDTEDICFVRPDS